MRHAAFPITAAALAALAGLAACAHPQSGPSSGPETGPTGEPGVSPPPVPTTFEAAQRQCDAGDQQACVVLSGFYWRGASVTRDPAKAKQLIESACAAGNALGCDLRNRYASPAEPVAAPESGAATAIPPNAGYDVTGMLDQRCGAHDYNACAGLGAMYLRGVGAPADAAKAKHYFQQACEGGNADGCRQLKSMGDTR
jgi:TPR repeat protein